MRLANSWAARGLALTGLVWALSLLCVFSGPAAAQSGVSTNAAPRPLPLAELLKKWQDTSLDEVRRLAEGGDVTAQHYLGYCHGEGLRVAKDAKLALSWYERAGAAGYTAAWNNIGVLYYVGEIVPEDPAKAVRYFKLAADGGLDMGQANLARMYLDGYGVQQDYAEAVRLLRLAVAQDHAPAKVLLGRCYQFGEGVRKDVKEARRLFQEASKAGEPLGFMNMGLLQEELGENEGAVSAYKEAAARGQSDAMVQLYLCYWSGKGVPSDHAEAVKWLTKGAEAGNAYGQCLLGYRYENREWVGEGAEMHLEGHDMPEALRWYRLSAKQNWAGGQFHLASCLLAGDGVRQDEEQALDLFRKAADQNHKEAMFRLAMLYGQGIGEPRNESDRPLSLLLWLGQVEFSEAYPHLEYRFRSGLGTERDLIEAARWYCASAKAGIYHHSIAGKLVPQPSSGSQEADDFSAALRLYLRAAKLDEPEALMQIGRQYKSGEQVPKDPVRAWSWFTIAADHGAETGRSQAVALESRMTAEELKRAKEYQTDLAERLTGNAAQIRAEVDARPGR